MFMIYEDVELLKKDAIIEVFGLNEFDTVTERYGTNWVLSDSIRVYLDFDMLDIARDILLDKYQLTYDMLNYFDLNRYAEYLSTQGYHKYSKGVLYYA